MGGPDVSAGLPVSPQGPDHIFISPRNGEMVGVWSLRILKTSDGYPMIHRLNESNVSCEHFKASRFEVHRSSHPWYKSLSC